MRFYDTIYLGCSAYAIAAAQQASEKVLILETGEGLAGEYVDALMTNGFERPASLKAQAFYDELIERRVMTAESAREGRISLPPVGVVLARIVRASGVNVLFKTRVISMEEKEEGVHVLTVCNAQIIEFVAQRVIDTRSDDFERIRRIDEDARCFLCANVTLPELPEFCWPGVTLQRGFLPQEGYLKMAWEKPAFGDRERFLSLFDNRPQAFFGVRLLLLCHSYGVKCRPICEKRGRVMFMPSCGFGNVMDAYAAGEQGRGL